MKYLTKEELMDITKELIENPTRETLKKLNEKYNGSSEIEQKMSPEKLSVIETPMAKSNNLESTNTVPNLMETNNAIPTLEVDVPAQAVAPLPQPSIENEVLPTIAPTAEVKVESTPIPSFEIPKLETPTVNNQNNTPVNFSGNLFDKPNMEIPNLMQTTDNFSAVQTTTQNTEVPVAPTPFFVTGPEVTNNQIPVGGPINNQPVQSPSMFSQFEQNYM